DEDDDDKDEEEELAKDDEEDKETGKGSNEVRESEVHGSANEGGSPRGSSDTDRPASRFTSMRE
nr:hypothetical protein [Tanacetum cinerariifolium]